MSNKIGIGLITFNREDFFKNSIASILKANPDKTIIVNGGNPYNNSVYPSGCEIKQQNKKTPVAINKNDAMRYLVQEGCDHIFIIEDDMLIKDPKVFELYIKAAKESGIYHLNFSQHGPANKTPEKQPNPRKIVEYSNNVEIALYPNCVGAVSYYLKGVIKNIGYIDERFVNAFDHVEHTYRIIQAGLHPPFWWFADLPNSHEFITEQACSTENTTIPRTDEWKQNFRTSAEIFKYKFGNYPTQVPDTSPEEVLKILDKIESRYARKENQ